MSRDFVALTNGTTYYFALRAVYADGNSELSDAASAAPQADRTPTQPASASLTGPASVAAGQSFDLIYGIASVTRDVYALNVTVRFDPAKVEFVSAESLADGFDVDSRSEAPGVIELRAADSSRTHKVTGTANVVKLSFRAAAIEKDAVNVIAIAEATAEDLAGGTTELSDLTDYRGSILANAIPASLNAKIGEAGSLLAAASIGSLWGSISAGRGRRVDVGDRVRPADGRKTQKRPSSN